MGLTKIFFLTHFDIPFASEQKAKMLAVKTVEKGQDAMTAQSAQALDHAAAIKAAGQQQQKVRFSGEEAGDGTSQSDQGLALPSRRPQTLTQFKWAQLEIGKLAPAFRGMAVVAGDFAEIALEDYRGQWVVLFFYPLDFTFVCPTEIVAFSDRFHEFKALNCAVVACSTDSHYSHLAWINTPRAKGGLGPMNIPILADKTGDIARRWGVMKEDEGITYRGLFIVDPRGNLRQITINDLAVGRCIDETLRLLQAYQFTDEHGEVCPANWTPGKPTIKPNPTEAQKYFQC